MPGHYNWTYQTITSKTINMTQLVKIFNIFETPGLTRINFGRKIFNNVRDPWSDPNKPGIKLGPRSHPMGTLGSRSNKKILQYLPIPTKLWICISLVLER